jgi:hypothetical protein
MIMAHELCDLLDAISGKEKRICDNGCENFKFPHLSCACVLSPVFSVIQGEYCYIYKEKKADK